MRKVILFVTLSALLCLFFTVGWFLRGSSKQKESVLSDKTQVKDTSLAKYSLDSLITTDFKKGEFKIIKKLSEQENYTKYLFEYNFYPEISGEQKNTTGQLNIPTGNLKFPLVFLIRGYVDQKIYTTGVGTSSAADYFAKNGFVTVAPDFLGYADSSKESANIFESRFQTYVTVLNLLKDINSGVLPTETLWNKKDIFIWAHSNGGQIALTSLAISSLDYPTTLWAPVTKPFPYSVLYYTDESDDNGKFIRQQLSDFESNYDVERFSFTNYLERITAPIQLHQGEKDDAVPAEWSKRFINKLKSIREAETELFIYPSADHNMRPDWNTAIARDLEFFKKYLNK